MNTQAENIRKIMEALENAHSIQETPNYDPANIAGMLRAFAKEVLAGRPSDTAAAYMIEAANIIDDLVANKNNL